MNTVRLRARNATYNRERRPLANADPELAESPPSQRRQQSPTAPGLKQSIPQSSQQPGAVDDDLDFAATLATAAKAAGFDPNIVIDDPSYRRCDSPPGSEASGVYKAPFAETVSDYGVFQTVEEPDQPGMYKPPFAAIEVEDDRLHEIGHGKEAGMSRRKCATNDANTSSEEEEKCATNDANTYSEEEEEKCATKYANTSSEEEEEKSGGFFSNLEWLCPSWPSDFTPKLIRQEKIELKPQLVAIFSVRISVLLILVPAGFVVRYVRVPAVAVFIINFLAIFPLAGIVGMATDNMMAQLDNILGSLIYMTFGNIVQLITSILLLKARQISILKTSLIGGILDGVLLVSGSSIFLGGTQEPEQHCNQMVAQLLSNFLTLSVVSLIIPTVSSVFANSTTKQIAGQSRGTAIALLGTYGIYLYFQLISHCYLFDPERPEGEMITRKMAMEARTKKPEKPNSVQLDIRTALVTLAVGTTLLAFNTAFAVDSINGLIQNHVSPSFVGLILLPLLGNDLLPLKSAIDDDMSLSLLLSAGKSMQISLFITPLIVTIAWIWGIEEMGLLFEEFQVAVLFIAVLLFRFLLNDGRTTYLHGVLLLSTYLIIAIAAWYN